MVVLSLLGGTLMTLFGMEYDSIGSLILYFVIIAIIGFPLDSLSQALPIVLVKMGKIEKPIGRIMFITLDTLSSFFVMTLIDYSMDSINATRLSILIISFIMALFSLNRDKL